MEKQREGETGKKIYCLLLAEDFISISNAEEQAEVDGMVRVWEVKSVLKAEVSSS